MPLDLDDITVYMNECAGDLELIPGDAPTEAQYTAWRKMDDERPSASAFRKFLRAGNDDEWWIKLAQSVGFDSYSGESIDDILDRIDDGRAEQASEEAAMHERAAATRIETSPGPGLHAVRVSMTAYGMLYVEADSQDDAREIAMNASIPERTWIDAIQKVAHEQVEED